MRNLIKNKKKKGFTLIEMVAVVAIIGILAAILVPKITGYLNEAKKTAVIDQARKVAQAYETAVMKNTLKLDNSATPGLVKTTTVEAAINTADNKGNTTMRSLVTKGDLKNLGALNDITIGHCLAITKGSDFEVKKDSASNEVIVVPTSVDKSYASK